MNTEEREFLENRNLVFTELGRFNVTFEYATHSFKSCIKNILINNGLENQTYADCLTDKLTAEPIKTIFQSFILHYFKSEEDKQKVNKIISSFSDLIEIRNLVIHCFWVIGVVVKEPVEPLIVGLKTRISKKGVSIYNLNFELKELIVLNNKLNDFNDLIYELDTHIKEKNENLIEFNSSLIEKLSFRKELNKMKSDLK